MENEDYGSMKSQTGWQDEFMPKHEEPNHPLNTERGELDERMKLVAETKEIANRFQELIDDPEAALFLSAAKLKSVGPELRTLISLLGFPKRNLMNGKEEGVN